MSLSLASASEPDAPPVTPLRRKSRWRRARWWLVAAALVAGGGLYASKKVGRGTPESIDTALITTAKRGPLEITVLETGRIEPRAQAQIKGRVGGQVIDVLVQEGERVKVGQLLLRLDPTDPRRDVARMTAEVEQQKLAAEFTALQLRRTEKAFNTAIAAGAELDQARHEAAMAKARFEAGRVTLETARDRLRYTAIEAPIAGTVTQRNVNPGEVVVPGVTATFDGKPLMVISDLSTLLVKVDLNQIDVAKVKRGQVADVTVDALPGKTFKATITRVAPSAVTPASRQGGGGLDVFPIEAQLSDAQDLSEIKPGMTADVRVLVERHEDKLLLPVEAVNTEKDKSRVHVLLGEGAERRTEVRDVEVGRRNDREIVIKGGLREGERVVIRPAKKDDKGGGRR